MADFNEQLRVGNVSFVSGCDRDNRSQANGKFRHNRTLSVWGLNDRLWSKVDWLTVDCMRASKRPPAM
ncbi:hypothetical protein [Sphingomonas sp. PB1R3]|uniref:hypothetical protein n=1 Tax=Sphingomonas flavida TaxID=3096154 RepID=UPI002FC9166E